MSDNANRLLDLLSRLRSGDGSPVGAVVPSVVGELYEDEVGGALWRATGLADTDWIEVGSGGSPLVGWREVVIADADWDVAGASGAWTVVAGVITCTADGALLLSERFNVAAWAVTCEVNLDAAGGGEIAVLVDAPAAVTAPAAPGVNQKGVQVSADHFWAFNSGTEGNGTAHVSAGFVAARLVTSGFGVSLLVDGAIPDDNTCPDPYPLGAGQDDGHVALVADTIGLAGSVVLRKLRLFVLDAACAPVPV